MAKTMSLDALRRCYPPGSRVTVHKMADDPAPLPVGSTGTLELIDDTGTFHVTWDNGRTLGLIPGTDRFTVGPPKPTLVKLYMPLTVTVFDEDELLDPVEVFSEEAVQYADQISDALHAAHLPEEFRRGLMRYYPHFDGVRIKVRSLFFTAEMRNGTLWGVAECQVLGELTPSELTALKDYVTGQAADGFGEGFEQRPILTPDGKEIYAHLWWPENWEVKTEAEYFGQETAQEHGWEQDPAQKQGQKQRDTAMHLSF